jgi:hypothetical protein
MNNSQNKQEKKGKENNLSLKTKKKDFWTTEEKKVKEFPVYPELGDVSVRSFIAKIFTGLFFSSLPSVFFTLGSPGSSFLYIWGVATMLVGGVFLLLGGCRDLSRTSARKSHSKYMERVERTGEQESFKFELGLFNFGNTIEDVGAGVFIFVIGALLVTFA